MTSCGASSQLSSLKLFLMELLSFSKKLLTLVFKLTKHKNIKQVTGLLHSGLINTTRFHAENCKRIKCFLSSFRRTNSPMKTNISQAAETLQCTLED